MPRFERGSRSRPSRDGPRRFDRDSDRGDSGFGGRERSRGGSGFDRRERSGPRRYGERDAGRSGFKSARDRPLVSAICDKCGKECMLPFKPTGDKPVYCSDCFRKDDSSAPARTARPMDSGRSAELQEISKKLDKIIELLENG